MSRIVVNIIDRFKKPKQFTDLVVFTDIRNYIPDWDTKKYLKACAKYAKEFSVYLVPTRFAVNNQIFMCMFSPEGEIIGIQGAIHLNLNFKGAFKTYDKINILDTPLGKIFLCVDVDIYHPEVTSCAKELGCEVIIASQFINTYEYHPHMLTKGIWNTAQSENVFVLGVNNNNCCLCAPCDITEELNGYITKPTTNKSVFLKIFSHKLQKPMDLKYIGNMKNREFYKNHYEQLIIG